MTYLLSMSVCHHHPREPPQSLHRAQVVSLSIGNKSGSHREYKFASVCFVPHFSLSLSGFAPIRSHGSMPAGYCWPGSIFSLPLSFSIPSFGNLSRKKERSVGNQVVRTGRHSYKVPDRKRQQTDKRWERRGLDIYGASIHTIRMPWLEGVERLPTCTN